MSKITLCVLVNFCLAIGSIAQAADNGLFMVVKGSVKVISGKDKSPAIAKVGSKVFSGDTVITEKDSRAKIVMADRNVLQLSPDTKIEITSYKTSAVESERTAQLALMQGKVRAQVEQKYGEKNKFEMRTPTAVAGVRGTQYVVQYNPVTLTTSVMVMSGKVLVSALSPGAAPVPVTPNQGVNVGANSTKLETFSVSKEQMNSFSNVNDSKPMDTLSEEPKESGGASPKGEPKSDGKKGTETRGPDADTSSSRMVSSDGPKNEPLPPPPPPPLVGGPAGGMITPPKPPQPMPSIPPIVPNTKTKVIVTPKPQ